MFSLFNRRWFLFFFQKIEDRPKWCPRQACPGDLRFLRGSKTRFHSMTSWSDIFRKLGKRYRNMTSFYYLYLLVNLYQLGSTNQFGGQLINSSMWIQFWFIPSLSQKFDIALPEYLKIAYCIPPIFRLHLKPVIIMFCLSISDRKNGPRILQGGARDSVSWIPAIRPGSLVGPKSISKDEHNIRTSVNLLTTEKIAKQKLKNKYFLTRWFSQI